MKRWFDSSVAFACTACGKCCQSRNTRVFVNPSEVKELATHKSVSVSEFLHQFTNTVKDSTGRSLVTLKGHAKKQQCIFLEGKACSVYDVRPTQCRTYPFWPQHMIGPAEWRAEANNCEGILLSDRGVAVKDEDIIDGAEVAMNMIVHEIHDRGAGEDWTCDTTVEMLVDTMEVGENPILEYLDGFFAANESRIVYESPELRVVDAKSLLGAPQSSVDPTLPPEDATEPPVPVVYSRRMEFVTTPHLSQTEVYLSGRPRSWAEDARDGTFGQPSSADDAMLDHSVLHMPVHKTMAKLIKQFLHRRKGEQLQAQPTAIAVIGAGCCALPSHLLSLPALANSSISVVEPSAEVLTVAERYFGAQFALAGASAQGVGMQPYCTDGETFLRTHSDLRFAVIVVDAFAQGASVADAASEADRGVIDQEQYAPPHSLLQCWAELHAALAPSEPSTSGGLLLVNVYGPASWVDHVHNTAAASGLFCSPVLVESAGSDVRAAPGAQNRNVVLTAMRVEDSEVFAGLSLRR